MSYSARKRGPLRCHDPACVRAGSALAAMNSARRETAMKPTILYKGKKYAGEEAMPPDVRREYQQAYQDDPDLAELAELQRESEAEGGEPAPGAPRSEHPLQPMPASCPTCGESLHCLDV